HQGTSREGAGASAPAAWSARSNRRASGLEAQFLDRPVEIAAELIGGRGQLVLRNAGQMAVDDPLIIADQPLDVLGQAHELEAVRVQPELLTRNVRIILLRNGR